MFGTHFSRGKRSVEVRIRNIFTRKNKWGYVFFAVLALAVIGGTCLWNVRENESSQTQDGSLAAGAADGEAEDQETGDQEIPVFDVDSVEELKRPGDFRLEDYYITNRTAAGNRFYIDSGSVLWGYGSNDYGQLGNGQRDELGVFYSPVLIEENVAYARTGGKCIVYLKNDGSVWWQGRYEDISYSGIVVEQREEGLHTEESWRMRAVSPQKLLDNCIYVTTGGENGAAISVNGELYTWGWNIMGQCGTPVSDDAFVREPVKVLDNVQMVWTGRMCFNSPEQEIPEIWHYNTLYRFTVFARLKDGTFMAAGEGAGDKEIRNLIGGGDLSSEVIYRYSDTFVPIQIE